MLAHLLCVLRASSLKAANNLNIIFAHFYGYSVTLTAAGQSLLCTLLWT